jgi:hypothetical protein
MSTDTPRQQVAAALAAALPGWLVDDYPNVPKQVAKGRPCLSVWRSHVGPGPARTHLAHELTINLYAARTQGAAAEDELDNLLDDVMLALERFPGWILAGAARQSFANDSIAGFQITGSVISTNVYRSTVIQERSSNGTATP